VLLSASEWKVACDKRKERTLEAGPPRSNDGLKINMEHSEQLVLLRLQGRRDID